MLTKSLRFSLRPLRPLRIDVYIITEILGPFLGATLFCTFIMLMFQLLQLAEMFIKHDLSVKVISKMILLQTLTFLPMVVPPAFLVGILVAFGRLSMDSEVIAMKSSGISVQRMTYPVLFLGFITAIFTLALNLDWVPWGLRSIREDKIKIGNTRVASAIEEGTFTTGFFDLLIYADKVDKQTNELKRVFIYDEREPRNPMTIVAQNGQILQLRTKTELESAVTMNLFQGNIHQHQLEDQIYQRTDFNEYRLYLNIEEGQGAGRIDKPAMLSQRDLKSGMRERKPGDPRYRELQTEIWRRFSLAMAPFLFVFIGIGMGSFGSTRQGKMGSVLWALLVLVGYWMLLAISVMMSQKGWLPPPVAIQLPNVVALVGGIYFYRKVLF